MDPQKWDKLFRTALAEAQYLDANTADTESMVSDGEGDYDEEWLDEAAEPLYYDPNVPPKRFGAVFVYDITDSQSLERLEYNLRRIMHESTEAVLLGNKSDLEQQRKVSRRQGLVMAKKYGVRLFFETSAKTGSNVHEAFDALQRNIVLTHPPKQAGQEEKDNAGKSRAYDHLFKVVMFGEAGVGKSCIM
eukprot:392552_1